MSKKERKNYFHHPTENNTIWQQNTDRGTMKDFTQKKRVTEKEGQRYFELICEEGTHKTAMIKVNRRFLKEFGYENTREARDRLNSLMRPYKPHHPQCRQKYKDAYVVFQTGLDLKSYDYTLRKRLILGDGILSLSPKVFKATKNKLAATNEFTLSELTELLQTLFENGAPHEHKSVGDSNKETDTGSRGNSQTSDADRAAEVLSRRRRESGDA